MSISLIISGAVLFPLNFLNESWHKFLISHTLPWPWVPSHGQAWPVHSLQLPTVICTQNVLARKRKLCQSLHDNEGYAYNWSYPLIMLLNLCVWGRTQEEWILAGRRGFPCHWYYWVEIFIGRNNHKEKGQKTSLTLKPLKSFDFILSWCDFHSRLQSKYLGLSCDLIRVSSGMG